MILLRSLLYSLSITIWTIIMLCTIGLPSFLISYKAVLRISQIWSAGSIFLLKIICNLSYEIKGIIPQYPCIVASKHQSAMETLILIAILKQPAFVTKKELRFFPVIGVYLIFSKMIFIDRDKKYSSMKKIITQSKEAILNKRQVVIFPEGSRTKVGQKIKYHKGIALLYMAKIAPVIPVRLNTGLFWGKNSFVKKPGKAIIEFMPPIYEGKELNEFMDELETNLENDKI